MILLPPEERKRLLPDMTEDDWKRWESQLLRETQGTDEHEAFEAWRRANPKALQFRTCHCPKCGHVMVRSAGRPK